MITLWGFLISVMDRTFKKKYNNNSAELSYKMMEYLKVGIGSIIEDLREFTDFKQYWPVVQQCNLGFWPLYRIVHKFLDSHRILNNPSHQFYIIYHRILLVLCWAVWWTSTRLIQDGLDIQLRALDLRRKSITKFRARILRR